MKKIKSLVGLKAAILTASMMTMMANAIIAPAMPNITKAFADVPDAEFKTKLMMTMPALSIALFASIAGWLVDRYGRLRVLGISLVVYALAGTSGLWLNDLHHILVGRFILGFGVAGVMTAATTLIGDNFKGEDRNAFIGMQGAFMGFGGMFFIGMAGVLSGYHWRYPFFIYGFSILVMVLMTLFIPEPEIEKRPKGVKAAGGEKPLLRDIVVIFFSGFFGMTVFYILPVQLPYYEMRFEGVTESLAGLALVAMTSTQTITAMFYRRIKKRFNFPGIYAICFSLMGIGLFFLGRSTNYIESLFAVSVVGMGAGWLMPNANLWMMAIVHESVRGRYIGILSMFTFFGMLLSPIVIQPLQNHVGMQQAFYLIAIGLVAAVAFYLYLSWQQNRKKLTKKKSYV